jgi:hypothetical protein
VSVGQAEDMDKLTRLSAEGMSIKCNLYIANSGRLLDQTQNTIH